MSNTFDKLSVLDSFIEEVNSYLPEIEANLDRLAQSFGDMDALEETYRRTHTIGGSASMMDFPGLAHVAHGMEDILGDALDGITTLDEPVLGLLQRSLIRLHQLLKGIRNGVDEEAVIAEDDADYSHYRALMAASAQSVQVAPSEYAAPSTQSMSDGGMPTEWEDNHAENDAFAMPAPAASAMPSFDEVLASFRTPNVEIGDDVAWPEEPASDDFSLPSYAEAQGSSPPHLSALDALMASTRPAPAARQPEEALPARIDDAFADDLPLPESKLPVLAQETDLATQIASFSQVYTDVQHEAQNVELQAAALKNLVAQLRSALSIIDMQRSEFKGFLDGSKDALDRMEDWAGRAMGLNLRNSPEQVRRYLPLSVMWVANSKLKKVLDQLNQTTGDAELADERMEFELQQLRTLLSSSNNVFQQIQEGAARVPEAEPAWTPWEMQREQDALRERVTFERYGNPEALRAEIEAQVREEYESRSISPAASRAELEQQIRSELRKEYEDLLRLQVRATSGQETPEVLQELEDRLRGEIEIQVRQDFLKQITSAEGEFSRMRQQARDTSPSSVSNYVERASEATERFASQLPSSATQIAVPEQPIPAAPSLSPQQAQQSSFAADLGEEATEIFRAEAEEHLQTISMHVAALEKTPQNLELIQAVRRATHTLKGAAGMMGFRAIADLCHIFEDLRDSIMEGKTAISSPVLSLILDTAEALDMLITGRDAEAMTDDVRVNILRARYTELLGEHTTPPPLEGHADAYIDAETDNGDDAIAGMGAVVGIVPDTHDEASAQGSAHGNLSVRVRLQKLDELVNLFGELLVNRSVLEERIQRLVRLVADAGVSSNRLRDVGQKLESRFEAATLPSGRSIQAMIGEGDQSLILYNNKNGNGRGTEPSHLAEFDELELDRYNDFHLLARGLSEGISDMTTLSTEMDTIIRECEAIFARENRLNTTFQDRLMKVRLVPLSSMTPRLYRAARAVALKQGKDFEFLLEGEETEVDRTVFEEIAGPLLHLVRNAVNHAMETPDVRAQRGKPPVGQIKLTAAYEGNQVVITVSDDGTGIDLEHVRNTAIQRGLIRPDQHLTETDVLNLIFLSGFSTAEVLSEESGRGVDLDVVRDSVSRLRGTLVVDSTPGYGTSFIMKFPTSLAIQSTMMVRVAGQQFAIPTVMVESIGRLDNFKRTTIAGQPAVLVRGDAYPLSTLAQYLSLPASLIDARSQLLLINASGYRVALMVDEIKSKQDIVTKSLGPHLRQVHGIAGGTVLGNGRVVLILELTELLAQRQRMDPTNAAALSVRREGNAQPTASVRQSIDVSTARADMAPTRSQAAASAPERGKHVLIVDDSPSVRRVVGNMLKQNQWEVQMARDGVEALEMISYETPAAVLLDIEMPRMDGYELIATIRSQEQYRTLPLIVLTSRAASKHQQRAVQLGANDYVVKPYQDEELLNKLKTLVYGAPVR